VSLEFFYVPHVCGFVGVDLVGLGRVNVVFGIRMVGVTEPNVWVGGNCCESPPFSISPRPADT
jgi:hypothetical protein